MEGTQLNTAQVPECTSSYHLEDFTKAICLRTPLSQYVDLPLMCVDTYVHCTLKGQMKDRGDMYMYIPQLECMLSVESTLGIHYMVTNVSNSACSIQDTHLATAIYINEEQMLYQLFNYFY